MSAYFWPAPQSERNQDLENTKDKSKVIWQKNIDYYGPGNL